MTRMGRNRDRKEDHGLEKERIWYKEKGEGMGPGT